RCPTTVQPHSCSSIQSLVESFRITERHFGPETMPFKQITIIGTGLIGGSLGLALKAAGYSGRIIGCDRPAVLDRARAMRAIDMGRGDPGDAIQGSDLIVLATPVGVIIDLIERIGPLAAKDALITDVGSTKKEILDRARSVFGGHVSLRFLGGHPMAGK